jgi:hypothetical protein
MDLKCFSFCSCFGDLFSSKIDCNP